MDPSIHIIILNWNGYEDSKECIKSLQQETYKNFHIVLIDNDSAKNEAELLKKDFPTIKAIRSDQNLGFSGGNNIGIKYSLEQNADYILLLNNDTIVERNFLEPLVDTLLQYKQVGIAAPKINYYSEPSRVWSAGGKIGKIRASGFADSDKLESQLRSIDREVDFVSGCCMLIRRGVFEKIGLFDDNYFLYVEDTDFCYRVKEAGYKNYVTPKSKIFHKVNNSTKKNNSLLPLYYTTRNRLYFAKKNFKATFYLTLVYMLIVMTIKSMYWMIVGRGKFVKAVILAFKDFFDNKMGKFDNTKFFDDK